MPPPAPALIKLGGILTKIKSRIYALHNLEPLRYLKGDSKF